MCLFTRNSRHFIAIISLGSLVACTNPPREVTAQVPLVNQPEISFGDAVPSQYWAILDDTQQQQLQHKQLTIHLGSSYQSALGMHCRTLYVETDKGEQQSRIACRQPKPNQDNTWYLTKNIVHSATAVEIK